ncbi:MAG TPA: hypothetical protein RWO09_01250 [Ruminococcus sp.]
MGKLFAILLAFVILVPSMLGYVKKSKEAQRRSEERMTYGYADEEL